MNIQLLLMKLKKRTPNKFYSYASKIVAPSKDIMYAETRKTFGDKNKDIEIFIIRRRPPGAGLFSNINYVLQGIIFAEKNNMIPVVDMKKYPVEYSRFLPYNNSRNAWEYFFKPISNITLKEAYKSKNIILSDGNRIINEPSFSGRRVDFISNARILKEFSSVYNNHIKLNDNTSKYIDYILDVQKIDINSTLGVFFRSGKDMQNAPGHPVQPKIEFIIEEIKDYLSSHNIKKIILSTADEKNRKILQNVFGTIICENFRLDVKSNFAKETNAIFQIPKGQLLRNISYLSEVYILAKLKYNIASLANGSVGIYLINNGMFERNTIYYKGVQN